jgi:hypothetical protein
VIANILQLTGAILTLMVILESMGVDLWTEVVKQRKREEEKIVSLFPNDEWLDKFFKNHFGEIGYEEALQERREAQKKFYEELEHQKSIKEKYRVKWYAFFGFICISLGYTLVFVDLPLISHTDVPKNPFIRIPLFIIGTFITLWCLDNRANKIAMVKYWKSFFKQVRGE